MRRLGGSGGGGERKDCALCEMPARMYCESDRASLCWDCDAKVHGANFLVARHSRSLLCRSCQEVTPWKASGPRLGSTVSVCDRCGGCGGEKAEVGGRDLEDEVGDEDEDEDGEEEEDEESDEEEEEEGENQVVPWTGASEEEALPPPPAASSSSSSDESYSSRVVIRNGLLKRVRDSADLASSQDDLACSPSSQPSYLPSPSMVAPPLARSSAEDEVTSFGSQFWPSKDRKRAPHDRPAAKSTGFQLTDL